MSNNLKELNDILFDQLRRLNTAETTEALDKEVARADSITKVAKPIIDGATLVLDAQKLKALYLGLQGDLPHMLEAKQND